MSPCASCMWSNTARLVIVMGVFALGSSLRWWTPSWWDIPLGLFLWSLVCTECECDDE